MNNEVSKTKKSSVKRKKQAKKKNSHSIVEECEILDGDVKLIRTTKSGKFWSMSCWLREEGKCYRRSMRTRDLDEAKELARNQFYKLKADIRFGNKIYSKTAEELVQDFVKHKTSEANADIITHGRVNTIRISLNRWFLKYVGHNKKIDKITRHDFEGYYVWRRKHASEVRNSTLVNERALISSLFKFGISRGYLKFDQTPIFPKLNIKRGAIERRDELSLKEWKQMYHVFPRWIKKGKNEKEIEQRLFIRDFLVILANTGLRFGELRKLKWSMIETNKSKGTGDHVDVDILVPADTKTGARKAVGKRGDVFARHSSLQMTQRYIEANVEAQKKIVQII